MAMPSLQMLDGRPHPVARPPSSRRRRRRRPFPILVPFVVAAVPVVEGWAPALTASTCCRRPVAAWSPTRWQGRRRTATRMVKIMTSSSSSSFASSSPSSHHHQRYEQHPSATNNNNSHNNHYNRIFQTFLLKLGRGIFFAKPAGPTVSQALFGLSIRSRRKNESAHSSSPQQSSSSSSSQQHKDLNTFSFTLRESLLGIALYLGVGVAVYSFLMEQWSWIDALYFSMVVFTTVGYGDVVPTANKPWVKLFTCVFSLGGVAFLAAALACLGSHVVDTETKATQAMVQRWRAARQRCRRLLAPPDTDTAVTAVVPYTPRPVQADDHQAKAPPTVHLSTVARQVVPRLALLVAMGVGLGRLEHWTLVDSIYYSLGTASTIGLGDKAPTTQLTRLLAVVCIPLMVATGGEILGTLATAVLQRRRAALFYNLVQKDFSMEHIKEMDSNGDGQVSKLDYIEFMLVEMEFVNRNVLDELESQFDRLDMTKGGTLSKKDLILMAKMRRRSVEKEVEEQRRQHLPTMEVDGDDSVDGGGGTAHSRLGSTTIPPDMG